MPPGLDDICRGITFKTEFGFLNMFYLVDFKCIKVSKSRKLRPFSYEFIDFFRYWFLFFHLKKLKHLYKLLRQK